MDITFHKQYPFIIILRKNIKYTHEYFKEPIYYNGKSFTGYRFSNNKRGYDFYREKLIRNSLLKLSKFKNK